jgi:Spy/CpxP family protein refolding chaperone
MKRLILGVALVLSASAVTVSAQQPGGGRMGPGPMPGTGGFGPPGGGGGPGAVEDPAAFLLAHTGEFKLTDAQVTRLAAIARRSAERRRALRVQMDSVRPQRGSARPDSATRERMRQRFEQMRPQLERLREQSQADRRDAIAVLTPDQQAQAWERIAASARMGRAGFGRSGGRGFDRRRMPGARMRGTPDRPRPTPPRRPA